MPMRAVLEQLHDDAALTVPQLARALFITRQAIQTVVDEAHDLGLVELRDNPAHQRSRLVVLSEAGRAAYLALHRHELNDLAQIAAELDPSDIEATVRVLGQLIPTIRTRVEEEES